MTDDLKIQSDTSKRPRFIEELSVKQRSNPYYFFVCAMFAVIIGRLAQWVTEIFTKLPNMRATSYEWLTVVVVPLGIACMFFFFIIHLWLYFSRVFVYIEESPVGETWTFILALSVLLSVCALPAYSNCWPVLLLTPTIFVMVKSIHVFLVYRVKYSDHPYTKMSLDWSKYSLLYALILSLLTACQFSFNAELADNQIAVKYQSILMFIILAIIAFMVFLKSSQVAKSAEDSIEKYLESNNIDNKTQ